MLWHLVVAHPIVQVHSAETKCTQVKPSDDK
jgi:hypothetical protein